MAQYPQMDTRIARRLAQKKKQLDAYRPLETFQALQQAHFGNYVPLIDLIGLAVEHALDLYLEACIESTAHLLPLKGLAPLFNTTVDYLGQLARTGKFEAKKRGQYWYASKEAIQQYFQEANEQPRGRPRTI